MSLTEIDKYLEDHLDDSIEELSELCRIPSVAAQNRGIQECAEAVASMLEKRGFKTIVTAEKAMTSAISFVFIFSTSSIIGDILLFIFFKKLMLVIMKTSQNYDKG